MAFARQVTLKNIQSQFTGNLDVQLDAEANLFFAIPSYTFKQNLLNGQATLAMAIPYGRSKAGVNATVSGNLGLGSGFTLGSALSEQIIAFGDLAPLFSLRWNKAANNFMLYLGGSLPVGAYNAKRLANLGTNHNSIDSGLGYTYFNYDQGHEFSSVIGWTYNFENK